RGRRAPGGAARHGGRIRPHRRFRKALGGGDRTSAAPPLHPARASGARRRTAVKVRSRTVARSTRHTSAATIAVSAVTVLPTVGCAHVAPESADPPHPSTAETQLDPYRPGMNLRETFDSLSQKPHQARIGLFRDQVGA